MISPWVFYERVIFIDDPEVSKFYVFVTSIPENLISGVEPLKILASFDQIKKAEDVVANTIFSCQIYSYTGKSK